MCGIFCCIVYNQNTFLNEISKKGFLSETNAQFSDCKDNLLGRGPDVFKELNVDVTECTLLRFAGCVLWTQGPKPVSQPLVDEDGNVLLWNGDIFSSLASCDNDTEILSKRLLEVTRTNGDVLSVITKIQGPYSFIFYHQSTKLLYFGRDALGRHSLVLQLDQRNVTLCSISSRSQPNVSEVPGVGVFTFDLSKDGVMPLCLHPWSHLTPELIQLKLTGFPRLEEINLLQPIESPINIIERKQSEPTDVDLSMWMVFRQDLSISQLMDKLNSSDSKARIKRTMMALSEKPDVQILVTDLVATLKDSLKIRLKKLPPYCSNCVRNLTINVTCPHSKVAILFSGGLDSAVLAALADGFIPEDEPIDLLNVAFERYIDPIHPKLGRKSPANGVHLVEQETTYKVPDRETGLQTLSELQALFPKRKWNFVEINVTQDELKKEREEKIADLIHPLNTILDDSLGCALWFASRGSGLLLATAKVPYTSSARIILSGIGADEQFGGYMRHRTTLRHKGSWSALERELCLELGRIAERNLGRDDRMVSSHGRQCRMPYLDENLVNFLAFLPPWQRCYPVDSMPPGLGDKLLLRLAAWHLGLRTAANLPKRAMQFGSRIANSREKATDVSNRLA